MTSKHNKRTDGQNGGPITRTGSRRYCTRVQIAPPVASAAPIAISHSPFIPPAIPIIQRTYPPASRCNIAPALTATASASVIQSGAHEMLRCDKHTGPNRRRGDPTGSR